MSITDEQKFFALTEALEAAAIAEESSSTEYGCSDRGEALAKLAECRLALLQYFREREFSRDSQVTRSRRDVEVMTFTIDENKLADIAGKSHAESSPEDWAGLILAVSERDSCIADLEQAVADSAVEIGRLQAELAELRKPVEVERNGAVEQVRAEAEDGRGIYNYRQLKIVLSAYDTLAQNAAAMRNAHDVLMAEMRGLREKLDIALIELCDTKYAMSTQLGAAEQRERQLRDGLRSLVDAACNEATESEQVPLTDWADRIIEKWRAALSQPQEPANGTV